MSNFIFSIDPCKGTTHLGLLLDSHQHRKHLGSCLWWSKMFYHEKPQVLVFHVTRVPELATCHGPANGTWVVASSRWLCLFFNLLFTCMHVWPCGYVHINAGRYGNWTCWISRNWSHMLWAAHCGCQEPNAAPPEEPSLWPCFIYTL